MFIFFFILHQNHIHFQRFLTDTEEDEALSVEGDDDDVTRTTTTSSSSAISAVERHVTLAQTKRKVDVREEIVTKRGSQPSGVY